jgi:hypothetical protein
MRHNNCKSLLEHYSESNGYIKHKYNRSTDYKGTMEKQEMHIERAEVFFII